MCYSISILEEELKNIKENINDAKINGYTNSKGKVSKGKAGALSLIRSGKIINHIHEVIKKDLVNNGIDVNLIIPEIGKSKPELRLTGYFKKKNQDVCIIPNNIDKKETKIDWGPGLHKEDIDEHGDDFTERTLAINVRSQLSSLAKNIDTLLERTFAESINLHKRCPNMVLGEVYMIPVYPYNTKKDEETEFLIEHTKLEEYISFFTGISNRTDEEDEEYKYERVALLIVDFSKENPKLYSTTKQLKDDGLVSDDFKLELEDISFKRFTSDLIEIYNNRFR